VEEDGLSDGGGGGMDCSAGEMERDAVGDAADDVEPDGCGGLSILGSKCATLPRSTFAMCFNAGITVGTSGTTALVFSDPASRVDDSKTLRQSSRALPMVRLFARSLANSDAVSRPRPASHGSFDGISETSEGVAGGGGEDPC
jgi:hypothetical protein